MSPFLDVKAELGRQRRSAGSTAEHAGMRGIFWARPAGAALGRGRRAGRGAENSAAVRPHWRCQARGCRVTPGCLPSGRERPSAGARRTHHGLSQRRHPPDRVQCRLRAPRPRARLRDQQTLPAPPSRDRKPSRMTSPLCTASALVQTLSPLSRIHSSLPAGLPPLIPPPSVCSQQSSQSEPVHCPSFLPQHLSHRLPSQPQESPGSALPSLCLSPVLPQARHTPASGPLHRGPLTGTLTPEILWVLIQRPASHQGATQNLSNIALPAPFPAWPLSQHRYCLTHCVCRSLARLLPSTRMPIPQGQKFSSFWSLLYL
ncbi:protein FAM166C isoform X1 [Equus quagga]|uniref:protein FAM166C isoform X1 n=1 Tax=Equus quagga TaxID=89248 RepID=UPI001EE2779D|nr:protein FAM166C isoform X1 [Equus quagga]